MRILRTSNFFIGIMPVLILSVIVSCKKTVDNGIVSGPGTGTVSATINGIKENFNVFISKAAITTAVNNQQEFLVFFEAKDNLNQIEISLLSFNSPITKGTYTDGEMSVGNALPTIMYTKDFKNAVANNFSNIYASDPLGGNISTVTITSINDTNITGNFSGTITKAGSATRQKLVITNGIFNMNLK